MSNLAVKEVEFDGDVLLATEVDGKVYVAVRWVSVGIGLTIDQAKRQMKNIREDMVLSQGTKLLNVETAGGMQQVLHLEIKYFPIWLSSINRNSLTSEQFTKLMKLLNWTLSADFDTYKYPTDKYEWEALLRDEIYNLGYFNEYKIIGKEIIHELGRIDLLAKDNQGDLVGIELKKDKNYNDIILQCCNHKKGLSNKYSRDVRIVICTLDKDDHFLKYAKKNNFEVYEYGRELKLNRIA